MLKLKEAIKIGIESGMTEFEVKHHEANPSRIFTIPAEKAMTVFAPFLNDDVITIYFGAAYSSRNKEGKMVYHRPTTCYINIKGEDETLMTE